MRILSIFGTRPEAIKMAPVLRVLRDRGAPAESIVCVTAQHRQMLDQVLALFGITPDLDLDLMQENQATGDFAALALARVNDVLDRVRPDVVLVQGDTTSAAAAALAAFYRSIPVGHVEAGLRTNDPACPFPEEINRRLIDTVSRYHFAPTRGAARALRAEGHHKSVYVTGNTVVDALQFILAHPPGEAALPALPPTGRTIVATAHRREHFGEPIRRICRALRALADRQPDAHVVYPVHFNPNVRSAAFELLQGHDRIHLIDPLPYDAFVRLMARAAVIITDSGGIQEEAPALGVPVIVVRDKTERREGLDAGAAELVGTETAAVVRAAERVLRRRSQSRARARNLFGDGHAAERIVEIILEGGARRAGRSGDALTRARSGQD